MLAWLGELIRLCTRWALGGRWRWPADLCSLQMFGTGCPHRRPWYRGLPGTIHAQARQHMMHGGALAHTNGTLLD